MNETNPQLGLFHKLPEAEPLSTPPCPRCGGVLDKDPRRRRWRIGLMFVLCGACGKIYERTKTGGGE